jgi:hypothetical protein
MYCIYLYLFYSIVVITSARSAACVFLYEFCDNSMPPRMLFFFFLSRIERCQRGNTRAQRHGACDDIVVNLRTNRVSVVVSPSRKGQRGFWFPNTSRSRCKYVYIASLKCIIVHSILPLSILVVGFSASRHSIIIIIILFNDIRPWCVFTIYYVIRRYSIATDIALLYM